MLIGLSEATLPRTVIFGKSQGRRNRFENGRGERADPSCRPAKRAEVSLKERTRASSQPRPEPLYSPSGEMHKLKLAVTNVRDRVGRTNNERWHQSQFCRHSRGREY